MKIKLLVGALVLLMVMNIAAIGSFLYVQARGPRPGMTWVDRAGRGDHRRFLRHMSREERQRLFATMRSFHEETRPLVEETRRLEDDLIASMNQSPAPRAHIDSLLQRISENRLQIARRATDRMIAMGDSLTPKEREHLVQALMRFRHDGPPDGPRAWQDRRERRK